MGFPVGYTEVFILPNLFLHTLSLLGFIRNLIFALFHFLGLSEFLETDVVWPETRSHLPENPSASALLIREFLPVVKFRDVAVDPPESCAVCLYEFEVEDEIRCLTNCKHIFHRACLDGWMDHDQKTCPLCRMAFVPDEMSEEFNQRLWAAFEIHQDYYRAAMPIRARLRLPIDRWQGQGTRNMLSDPKTLLQRQRVKLARASGEPSTAPPKSPSISGHVPTSSSRQLSPAGPRPKSTAKQ